jgi:hypothetical protein
VLAKKIERLRWDKVFAIINLVSGSDPLVVKAENLRDPAAIRKICDADKNQKNSYDTCDAHCLTGKNEAIKKEGRRLLRNRLFTSSFLTPLSYSIRPEMKSQSSAHAA